MKTDIIKTLVLDDDPKFHGILEAKTNKELYRYAFSQNITSFLSKVKTQDWDLFIIDLNLEESPEAGFEVIKYLRGKANILAPILMISREQEKDKIAHAIECGADDYLSKPFDNEIFAAKVDYLLGDRELSLNKLQTIPVPYAKRAALMKVEFDVYSIAEDAITLESRNYISKGSYLKVSGAIATDLFQASSLPLEVIKTQMVGGLYRIVLQLDTHADYAMNVKNYIRRLKS